MTPAKTSQPRVRVARFTHVFFRHQLTAIPSVVSRYKQPTHTYTHTHNTPTHIVGGIHQKRMSLPNAPRACLQKQQQLQGTNVLQAEHVLQACSASSNSSKGPNARDCRQGQRRGARSCCRRVAGVLHACCRQRQRRALTRRCCHTGCPTPVALTPASYAPHSILTVPLSLFDRRHMALACVRVRVPSVSTVVGGWARRACTLHV